MVGEACLPSNAYDPRTPDYTLCSGVHVCWSEHSDSSFVYGFMSLDYGFGTSYIGTRIYGDLVYRFRKNVGKSNFSEQFRKVINRYRRIGYSLDIMRQTACLVVNPIIVDGYASLFNCTTAVRASDSMTASS